MYYEPDTPKPYLNVNLHSGGGGFSAGGRGGGATSG